MKNFKEFVTEEKTPEEHKAAATEYRLHMLASHHASINAHKLSLEAHKKGTKKSHIAAREAHYEAADAHSKAHEKLKNAFWMVDKNKSHHKHAELMHNEIADDHSVSAGD